MRALLRWHPALMTTAGLMVVLSLLHAAGLALDDRSYGSSPNWMKPLKFSFSFILYTAWLAALIHLLERASGAAERKARKFGNFIVFVVWVEMIFIDVQTLRGTTSHFNFRTIPEAVIYEVAGFLAMGMVAVNVLLVYLVIRRKAASEPVLLALKTGTWLLVASGLVGVFMAFPKVPGGWSNDVVGGHSIGADIDHAVVPYIFWAAEGGDLRVPHFIGLHAFQLLPLAAMIFHRWVNTRVVWVLSAGYTGVFLISFFQAMAGEAPFDVSTPTVVALAVTALATALGLVWALRTPPVPPASERAAEPVSAHR
ncbi:hypothetical protein BBK82_44675 [Lentzea guizhouensis]|uniref:Uncharacterized protein n=1 Tax=Lentzea guizhouensis TaxID=1586287 RepID=A0A1B2HWB8_9PSEU|nr:hypothetical protein [Lentzea guizhouensis]ANZ41982.1 hypothetical protein BBK82_44675 [Lentzea guizhouensis]